MISKRKELRFGFDFGGILAQPERLICYSSAFSRQRKRWKGGSDDLSDMLSRRKVYLERDD
jgi:hypothetical protein